MLAEYTVKRNGKWYHAGEEIDEVVKTTSLPFNDKAFTKTEINRMSTDDLKSLAAENGVVGYEFMTGSALKEYFINLFGL